MTFEQALDQVGSFGRFQYFLIFYLCLLVVPLRVIPLSVHIFTLLEPPHWWVYDPILFSMNKKIEFYLTYLFRYRRIYRRTYTSCTTQDRSFLRGLIILLKQFNLCQIILLCEDPFKRVHHCPDHKHTNRNTFSSPYANQALRWVSHMLRQTSNYPSKATYSAGNWPSKIDFYTQITIRRVLECLYHSDFESGSEFQSTAHEEDLVTESALKCRKGTTILGNNC